jgi:hypothetical protein
MASPATHSATIAAGSSQPLWMRTSQNRPLTDAQGYYQLTDLPAGKYLFATLRPRETAGAQPDDPNDQSHILHEVMDLQTNLNLTVDYQTRSISK